MDFNLPTAFGNAVAISQSSGHQLIGKQTYDSMRAAEKNSERFAKLFKGSIDKILVGSSRREKDAVFQRQIERTDVSLNRFFPALLIYVRGVEMVDTLNRYIREFKKQQSKQSDGGEEKV